MDFKAAVAFVGGIIERRHEGKLQVLIQTRAIDFPNAPNDIAYNGTFEFVAGQLDKPFENVYETLAREIAEETGLVLKAVVNDSRTDVVSSKGDDATIGFRPFCCVQQLRFGNPWIGFIFRCEVEDSEPRDLPGETRDVHWRDASEVKEMVENTPEKLFGLELPAWQYYFNEVEV